MNLAETLLDGLDEMKAQNEALALRDEAAGEQTVEYYVDRLRYEHLADDTFNALNADGDRDALDRLVRDHRDALDDLTLQHYDAMPKPWTLRLLREPVENDLTEAEREAAKPHHHHHL